MRSCFPEKEAAWSCCYRFACLSNAHCKKWGNHAAMLALWFAFYNFARKHVTLKENPTMASGLADHVCSIRELIEESAKH